MGLELVKLALVVTRLNHQVPGIEQGIEPFYKRQRVILLLYYYITAHSYRSASCTSSHIPRVATKGESVNISLYRTRYMFLTFLFAYHFVTQGSCHIVCARLKLHYGSLRMKQESRSQWRQNRSQQLLHQDTKTIAYFSFASVLTH